MNFKKISCFLILPFLIALFSSCSGKIKITVTSESNTVEYGEEITLTATTSKGDYDTFFEWYVDGVINKITSKTFIYSPIEAHAKKEINIEARISKEKTKYVAGSKKINVTLPKVTITSENDTVEYGKVITLTATTYAYDDLFEWYVDGVKNQITSKNFTYSPLEAHVDKEINIEAKVNNDSIEYIPGSKKINVTRDSSKITIAVDRFEKPLINHLSSDEAEKSLTFTLIHSGNIDYNSDSYRWYVGDVEQPYKGKSFTYTPTTPENDMKTTVKAKLVHFAYPSDKTSNEIEIFIVGQYDNSTIEINPGKPSYPVLEHAYLHVTFKSKVLGTTIFDGIRDYNGRGVFKWYRRENDGKWANTPSPQVENPIELFYSSAQTIEYSVVIDDEFFVNSDENERASGFVVYV